MDYDNSRRRGRIFVHGLPCVSDAGYFYLEGISQNKIPYRIVRLNDGTLIAERPHTVMCAGVIGLNGNDIAGFCTY